MWCIMCGSSPKINSTASREIWPTHEATLVSLLISFGHGVRGGMIPMSSTEFEDRKRLRSSNSVHDRCMSNSEEVLLGRERAWFSPSWSFGHI